MNTHASLQAQLDDRWWLRERNIFMDWSDPAFFGELSLARRHGRRVVVCNGCFDLLHAGHLWLLDWAKYAALCGRVFLVVAVNRDATVRRLKGEGRPVVPFSQRLYALAALKAVDCVVGFGEATPEALLEAVRPEALVKGSEYAGERVPGAQFAGLVVKPPMQPDTSTTILVERLRK